MGARVTIGVYTLYMHDTLAEDWEIHWKTWQKSGNNAGPTQFWPLFFKPGVRYIRQYKSRAFYLTCCAWQTHVPLRGVQHALLIR
jgi:hypothetical protein